MSFRTLYIKEHEYGKSNKIDTQIFILYDPMESTYFYYGSRRMYKCGIYTTYNGHYHCNRIDALNKFLEYNLGKYNEVITFEMHDLKIDPSEYNELTFDVLQSKLKKGTEMFAYDQLRINKSEMYDLLDMLVTHEV